MKFISKSANLNIIIRPGLPAQPLSGLLAKPAISVRFQNGLANVEDDELVRMMIAHPGFNSDFISAEDVKQDPYASLRQENEPSHIMTELKYGTPQKTTSSGKTQLPPEVTKLIQAQAIEIAKQMLPSMVEEALKSIIGSMEATKAAGIKTTVDVPEALKMEATSDVDTEDSAELNDEEEAVEITPEVKKGVKAVNHKK